MHARRSVDAAEEVVVAVDFGKWKRDEATRSERRADESDKKRVKVRQPHL